MHDLQQITVKLNWFGVFTLSLPLLPTHRHTFLWPSHDYHAPPCWILIHSFSFSIPFSSRIRPSLSLPLFQLCGGFFVCFFLSLPLLHNFSLLKLQSRRGETLFPPHELLRCLRAAVMTAPGSAVATRLLRSGFTVDPGSTAQWELFIIPLTHSHCRSQLTAHLPAARGAANRDTQSLKETHTDGHKKNPSTHTHKWKQHIASKVIDRALWVATVPVQLQSLLSLREICHGQSESELQRISPWGL